MKDSATKTSIAVSWTAPASDGGAALIDYRLYYTDMTLGNGWVSVPGITETTYTLTGLKTGHNYKFNVYARNSVGESN